MYEPFIKKFNEKIALNSEEESIIKNYITEKKLRRKQYLLQADDICKYVAFVGKGVLKTFVTDPDGLAHITAFALEGQFITDLYSFSRQEPSSFNIDAVEDADLVLVSKTAHDELLKIMPKYETFFRILMTEDHIDLQRRTANMISLTLEQRFQAFSKIYADLIQRVPQHMIASYMGISAETLSRIRSKLSGKN